MNFYFSTKFDGNVATHLGGAAAALVAAQNRERLRAKLGLARLVFLTQTHGDGVLDLDAWEADCGANAASPCPQNEPKLALSHPQNEPKLATAAAQNLAQNAIKNSQNPAASAAPQTSQLPAQSASNSNLAQIGEKFAQTPAQNYSNLNFAEVAVDFNADFGDNFTANPSPNPGANPSPNSPKFAANFTQIPAKTPAQITQISAPFDAVFTARRGIGLCVMVADCAPVLLLDRARGVIAAIHAGRAGVFARICTKTLAAMRSRPQDVCAVVGPHICAACYEVRGVECGEFARFKVGERLDLSAALRAEFVAAGVGEVHFAPECSRCDGRFFSYRRFCAASGGAGVGVGGGVSDGAGAGGGGGGANSNLADISGAGKNEIFGAPATPPREENGRFCGVVWL